MFQNSKKPKTRSYKYNIYKYINIYNMFRLIFFAETETPLNNILQASNCKKFLCFHAAARN